MMRHLAVFLFAGLMLLSGCSLNRWVSTPVLDQYNTKVRLEYLQEGGKPVAQGYNHPYTIDPADLERLLLDLKFNEKVGMVEKAIKGQKTEPVFQGDEAAVLAPAISEALAKATPDQRVHLLSFNRGGGLIFASRRVTEGVIFVESPDRLNIAFNVINYELLPDQPDAVPDEYKFRDPTTVKDSWAHLIPEASYLHLQPMDNGKNSPVWIVADVKEFKKMPKTQTPPIAQQQETIQQPPAAINVEKPAAVAPVEKQPVEQPVAQPPIQPPVQSSVQTPVQPSVQPPPQPVAPQANKDDDIKNKLRLLKELYDDGLITQSEYEAKKKEILKNIE